MGLGFGASLPSTRVHVKLFSSTCSGFIRGNLTSGEAESLVWSQEEGRPKEASLLVNARVRMAPEALGAVFEACLRKYAGRNFDTRVLSMRSLSPARPQPTYQYGTVV